MKLCQESINLLKEHWNGELKVALYKRQFCDNSQFEKWNKRVSHCNFQIKIAESMCEE
jgi:hypothetical protein